MPDLDLMKQEKQAARDSRGRFAREPVVVGREPAQAATDAGFLLPICCRSSQAALSPQ